MGQLETQGFPTVPLMEPGSCERPPVEAPRVNHALEDLPENPWSDGKSRARRESARIPPRKVGRGRGKSGRDSRRRERESSGDFTPQLGKRPQRAETPPRPGGRGKTRTDGLRCGGRAAWETVSRECRRRARASASWNAPRTPGSARDHRAVSPTTEARRKDELVRAGNIARCSPPRGSPPRTCPPRTSGTRTSRARTSHIRASRA